MNIAHMQTLKDFLKSKEEIQFAYLFGSHAKGTESKLSDIDVGVYVSEVSDLFSYRLRLMEEVSCQMGGCSIDLIVLNDSPLVLQYEIIRYGKILKEDKRKRVSFETGVLRNYLDTEPLRATRLASIKRAFCRENQFGQ